MIYPLTRRRRLRSWVRWLFSRWFVATVLDRSDRTCWADLATWAAYGGDGGGHDEINDRLNGGTACRVESAVRENHCYCGKFVNGCLSRNPAEVSS